MSSQWYPDDAASSRRQLVLRSQPKAESDFAPLADRLQVSVLEYPRQVRFPSYIGSGSTPVRHILEVVEEGRPVHATCKARLAGNGEETYIYKRVDRFGYVQEDSQALEHELRVLEMLHSTTAEGIVKLTGVVVSENPYQTTKDDSSKVLRGILLEYHPNGTLEEALASARRDTSWHGWGLQIASALARLSTFEGKLAQLQTQVCTLWWSGGSPEILPGVDDPRGGRASYSSRVIIPRAFPERTGGPYLRVASSPESARETR